MKYISLILFTLLSGCALRNKIPFLQPAPVADPPPPLPQPDIVDPIDLIFDGNSTKILSEQSHVDPFLLIITLVLIICLTPMLYLSCKPYVVKCGPYLVQFKDWSKEKLIGAKEWIKKRLKERNEKKLDPKEK